MLALNKAGEGKVTSSILDSTGRCVPDGTSSLWEGRPDSPLEGCPAETDAFYLAQKNLSSPLRASKIIPFLDRWTQDISQVGALLGLGTLILPHFRPLRALGAMGIGILSSTPVAATLLSAGTYLTLRHKPLAEAALTRMISGDYRKTDSNILNDGLFLGSYGIGVLGIGIGWAGFGLGTRTFIRTKRDFFAQGYAPKKAFNGAFIHGDAVRRAVMDPLEWIHLGGARPNSPQSLLLVGAGKRANQILVGGSAVFGSARLGLHGAELWEQRRRRGHWEGETLFHALANFALDVGPGVTALLYRSGRGYHSHNLGPALSQNLTEAVYSNPSLRELVYHRIGTSVPPLRPKEEYDFLNQRRNDLETVGNSLDRAEELSPLERLNGTGAPLISPDTSPEKFLLHPIEKPVSFLPEAKQVMGRELALQLSQGNLSQWRKAYTSGKISPTGVLRYILQHPATKNTAIFPRDLATGELGALLKLRAQESELRFETGTTRPLEGIFVPVKDVFPGLDGTMMVGSKTTRIRGVKDSPVLTSLLDQGAIPYPVGMVAAANGGSGMNAGFGYIPHPSRPEFDPAGSSSATAHVLGLKDFPAVVGIGTDTGGSVTAPAGAVGLTGFVPPRSFLSTDNMVPFDTLLDRVGVLSLHSQDSLFMVRCLTRRLNGHAVQALQPGTHRPDIVFLKGVLNQASPEGRRHFLDKMEKLKGMGFTVRALDRDWNFLAEAPLLLYPIDAYGAAAFAHTNPLQKNLFEPPRRSLDRNLWTRLPRGEISLRYGLFDQARHLTIRYQGLVKSKLGTGVVLASPSTEAIRKTALEQGQAGSLLDQHDRITMAKNRIPEWGQISLPDSTGGPVGVVFSGHLPNLMHFIN